jgi:hypothetical protein
MDDPSKLSFSRPFVGVVHVLDDEALFSFRSLRSVAASFALHLQIAPTRRADVRLPLRGLRPIDQDQRGACEMSVPVFSKFRI